MRINVTIMSILLLIIIPFKVNAQTADYYEIATWYQFKDATVTYTFDGYNNNSSKQLSVALPLFDNFNFKITLCTITDWINDWTPLQQAANNGHEISSLTVTHNDLSKQDLGSQEKELKQSQSIINSYITSAKCVTLAYPYCITGDLALIQKYYIAGRKCNGAVESSNPDDLYGISSIITGSEGAVKTAQDLNNKVSSARSSKGWCVFLIHGIDNDGGYSPIPSSEISSHLEYMNSQLADYWIATFADVVKYIKERNNISLSETKISPDSLRLTVSDNLDNTIYYHPITIRRQLPENWSSVNIVQNDQPVEFGIKQINSVNYIIFDVVPDEGDIILTNKTENALKPHRDNNSKDTEAQFADENPVLTIPETFFIKLCSLAYDINDVGFAYLNTQKAITEINYNKLSDQKVYIYEITDEKTRISELKKDRIT